MSGRTMVLFAALLFGTTGTAQALGAPDAATSTVGVLRLVIGAVGLAGIAAARGTFRPYAPLPRAALVWAVIGVVAYQVTFFAGVRSAGVAVGTMVTIGSAPLLVGFLTWMLTRRSPGRRWLTVTAIGIAGVALIGASDAASVPVSGVLLALAAGLSYAVYAIGSERLVRSLHPSGAMAWVYGLAALASLPMLVGTDLSWLGTGRGLAAAAWLGLATTSLAYLLFATGLETVPVTTASTLILGEPATAVALGVLVLGERPGGLTWIGVGLVSVALLLTGLGAAGRT